MGVPAANAMVSSEIVCIGVPLPSTPAVPVLAVTPAETVGTVPAAKVQVSLIRGSLAQKSTTSDEVASVVAGVNVREYSAWALAAEVLITILRTVIWLASAIAKGKSWANRVATKRAVKNPGNRRRTVSRKDFILPTGLSFTHMTLSHGFPMNNNSISFSESHQPKLYGY